MPNIIDMLKCQNNFAISIFIVQLGNQNINNNDNNDIIIANMIEFLLCPRHWIMGFIYII